MSSEFSKATEKVLKKYPEVFQALEEYDKTHKLKKIYGRRRLNITIDENVLGDFKEYSKKNALNISRFIEEKMRAQMRSS